MFDVSRKIGLDLTRQFRVTQQIDHILSSLGLYVQTLT
jgi:hypothetical protein